MTIRIGSISMDSMADKQANIKKHLKFIERAAKEKIDLLVFPEASIPGFGKEFCPSTISPDASYALLQTAESVPSGPTTQLIMEQAKKNNMYISFGIFEKDTLHCERAYNTVVLVGPNGFIGKYHKIHQPGTERLYFFPGDHFEVFDTPIGRIGIIICFEQSYPEASRCLKLLGAEIVICPTAWPATDLKKIEDDPLLMQYKMFGNCRAMENSFIFVASNQYCSGDALWCGAGHARIINPQGVELASTGFEEGIAIADVDVKKEIQKSFSFGMGIGGNSFFRDMRPDIYIPVYETFKK